MHRGVCEWDAGMGAGVGNAHHMLNAACDPMVGSFPAMLLMPHCASDTRYDSSLDLEGSGWGRSSGVE